MEIMGNFSSYGGVMAALTATLLSDVMNADPQVVHHVHMSGLGKCFLQMIMNPTEDSHGDEYCEEWVEPCIPDSTEFIMAIPNVLSALALTEDGAKRIREANPFPSLLSIFCSRKYGMPHTRCLLNEMGGIIGTGLDELMRHVRSLKPLIMKALVGTMKRILFLGEQLLKDEAIFEEQRPNLEDELVETMLKNLEHSRTYIMQYTYNIGQLLDQILHNEDHCSPFVDVGGIDLLLQLYPILMPRGSQLLSHMSCLSSPTVASFTHSTTASAFHVAIKSIASHYNPLIVIQKLIGSIEKRLNGIKESQKQLRIATNHVSNFNEKIELMIDSQNDVFGAVGVLEGLPRKPLHHLIMNNFNAKMLLSLSDYLRDIVTIEWMMNLLSAVLRAASQRSGDTGSGWRKEICSEKFEQVFTQLSSFYQSSMYEVCRIRTEPDYELLDLEYRKAADGSKTSHHPALYKLRIVCAEGAVVRDGIEIDSCESVGGLEFGEIVEAFDRCINSSGVMRYRTRRGWVSEQTRGHGREPIAEVLSIEGTAQTKQVSQKSNNCKRVECGVPDICNISASVLARLQNSQASLYSCLSRVVVMGIRSLPGMRSLTSHVIGDHVKAVVCMMSKILLSSLNTVITSELTNSNSSNKSILNKNGVTLYLGNVLSIVKASLYEEKRDTPVLNLPLLLSLLFANDFTYGIILSRGMKENSDKKRLILPVPEHGFIGAIRLVLKYSLLDVRQRMVGDMQSEKINNKALQQGVNKQVVSRYVAASFPTALSLLRRLITRNLIINSQVNTTLSKLKSSDLFAIISSEDSQTAASYASYSPVRFAAALHSTISPLVEELWNDENLALLPPHLMNPVVHLVNELVSSLDESSKQIIIDSTDTQSGDQSSNRDSENSDLQQRLSRNLSAMNVFLGGSARGSRMLSNTSQSLAGGDSTATGVSQVVSNEETINLLIDMGFTREHAMDAIESTGSTRLEVVMEYALSHPPPSPRTIERRSLEGERSSDRNDSASQQVANSSDDSNNRTEFTANSESNNDDRQNSNDNERGSMDIDEQTNESQNSSSSIPGTQSSKIDISEEEKKKQEEKVCEMRLIFSVQLCLKSLRSSLISVALGLIERKDYSFSENELMNKTSQPQLEGNIIPQDILPGLSTIAATKKMESEASTIVICSFLLDICERYPKERSNIVTELLCSLKSKLIVDKRGSHCKITPGEEASFASLCHAAVIFLRALPRTRVIALRKNLVSCLLQCIKSSLTKIKSLDIITQGSWPQWLASALLLIDIMAQPTAISLNECDKEDSDTHDQVEKNQSHKDHKGEFAKVCSEHKRQISILAKTAKRICSAINERPVTAGSKKKKIPKDKDDKEKLNLLGECKSPPVKASECNKSNNTESLGSTVNEKKSDFTSAIQSFPAFLPLITPNTAEFCMNVCIQLLRLTTYKSSKDTEVENDSYIPSDVAQATLLLFTRVLRSYKVSSQCLKMGGAELLLNQSSKSRFTGHSGLITVALRRMLEDESTLQTAMETEIRSTVTKLHKKQSRSSDSSRPKVNSRSFIQAITPLICRDPIVFMKAAACSVRVEAPPSGSVGRQSKIVLLSSEERSKSLKALSECFKSNISTCVIPNTNTTTITHTPVATKHNHKPTLSPNGSATKRGRQSQKSKSPHSKISKSKSPHRHSLSRRSMSPRKLPKREKFITIQGTPSNHVISLLLNLLMKQYDIAEQKGSLQSASFLSVVDYLEIIADLVLAVPVCAAAIHRFHPSSYKDFDNNNHPLKKLSHALFGFPCPPRNAVNYFLHKLLPQARIYSQSSSMSNNNNGQEQESSDSMESKKRKQAYVKVRISQSTARLLVALVARAGEGRRRVISDLTHALTGGIDCYRKQDQSKIEAPSGRDDDKEMWALQSWGELCIGLAAPRSTSINQDNNSSLSFEVVRVMLDCGMAHALLHGIKRIRLHHPLAATSAAALLRPLEVFTRGSVVDAVQEMEKEPGQAKKLNTDLFGKSKGTKRSDVSTEMSRGVSLGASQQNENAFADDAMLEDGFDAHTAERNVRRHARQQDLGNDMIEIAGDENVYEEVIDDTDSCDEDVDDEFSEDDVMDDDVSSSDEDEDNEDDSDGEEIEVRLGHPDETDDENDEDSDSGSETDEEMSSDDESDDSERSESSTSTVDIDENIEEDVEVAEENVDANNGDEVAVETFDWDGEEENDFLEGLVEYVDDEEDSTANWAEPEEDGWTRIEQPGIGQMFVGVRTSNAIHGRSVRRRGGFIIEAAEAMIGNILRNGDIRMNALAEIEDTLGIRIMHHRSDSDQRTSRTGIVGEGSASTETNTNRNTDNESSNSWNRGPVGSVPTVHQNNPPDSGFSSISTAGGRVGELNSMDYVYGRHAIGSGSIYYDLNLSVPGIENNPSDNIEVPSTVDTHLFPGGPAASTHSRTHQSLHPLLCGVDLPPINALRSINRSHHSQFSRGSRTTSDSGWTSILATSRGMVNILNRGPTQSSIDQSRTNGSLVAWTDDGQPLDGTVGEFTLAFEQALGETITQDTSRLSTEGVESTPTNANSRLGLPRRGAVGNANISSISSSNNFNESTENETSAEGTELQETRIRTQGTVVNSNSEVSSSMTENNGNASEGEAFATSLATGLSLSSANDRDMGSNQNRSINNDTSRNHDQSSEVETQNVEALSVTHTTTNERSVTDVTNAQQGISSDTIEENVPLLSDQVQTNERRGGPNEAGLVCPPGMDFEVFSSLPLEMQREIVQQHQETLNVAAQLDASSGLDPEALAALPEEMRREVIEQEQHERRLRDQAPADPSNAEEMDNASFIVSLAPDLREEILMTAEESFLNTLPPDIIAEAQLLRERAASNHRRNNAAVASATSANSGTESRNRSGVFATNTSEETQGSGNIGSGRRRNKIGKMRTECNRSLIIYAPPIINNEFGPLITSNSLKALIRLTFLLSPVRPQRLLQKIIQNICSNADIRKSFLTCSVALLNNDPKSAQMAVNLLDELNDSSIEDKFLVEFEEFPPTSLIGTAPEVIEHDMMTPSTSMFRRRYGGGAAASIAANLPASSKGSVKDKSLPPVVARRLIGTISFLSKNFGRVSLDMLRNFENSEGSRLDTKKQADGYITCLDKLLDLLDKPLYTKSSTNLEELLNMIESIVAPLSLIPKDSSNDCVSDKEINAAAAVGKEYVDVPRTIVSPKRLQLLCSILRMESCKDACFTKVNTISRRLCRVESNRSCILRELASVAQRLGADAIRDLRSLSIRLNDTLDQYQEDLKAQTISSGDDDQSSLISTAKSKKLLSGTPSSAVTLSTSSSEIKLLRVLQTLHSLCGHNLEESKKNDGSALISYELVTILRSINLEVLWEQLNSCLCIVSVLEGVSHIDDKSENKLEDNDNDNGDNFDDDLNENNEGNTTGKKKLQNSVAGFLTRFLPTIEAFFVVNASVCDQELPTKENVSSEDCDDLGKLVGGKRLIEFVGTNKVLLNALLRSNPSLLDKGLRAMVQVPRSRPFLDFDVKRQWFKTQVRRLRRRHSSLRLTIRRDHVFEDAYHQLIIREADEMRGRLHITFRNEEGVDAGGLSREFFAILAKEMFNPNYALFTSTEDGCTFQPNPHSSINPDHLSYFQFVGRIVGKAVVDGFLLDAHFTRSLYKHMLGIKPTHHDMQAIDPDYYKNLKMILEYNLGDIGLDLTFSTEAHSFGRSQTIDLIKDGRNIKVTEQNKEKYVSLVCQHRMTTAIEKQIEAYLKGFYELVKPELISIFTAKELELLISGLPDIDIHDLKKNTEYHGYKSTDKEIEWFWNIVFSLSRSDKAAFLQFATGSSKVPLAGFAELQGMRGIQKFSIHKAGGSSGALMSAHTCFNALDLPIYKNEGEMREKLLYAIQEGGGGFLFA